jgi:peroxiredoxin
METKDVNTNRWLSGLLSKLTPGDDWQPDMTRSLLVFREQYKKGRAKKRRLIWIAAVTSALIVALLTFPFTRSLAEQYVSTCAALLGLSHSAGNSAATGADYRKPAPDFNLTDMAGSPMKIADLRGRVVLLTFWTKECDTCSLEMSWFREFQQTYRERGLVFVNHQIVPGTDDIRQLFGGLDVIPTTLLIDRAGRIAVTHVGYCSRSEFDDAIKALLNEH